MRAMDADVGRLLPEKVTVVVRKFYRASRTYQCEVVQDNRLVIINASTLKLEIGAGAYEDLIGAVLEVTLRRSANYDCIGAKFTKPLHEQ
jgi:hypothetical protein